MLRADQTAWVLRALDTASDPAGSGSEHSVLPLLTPHEAHQLVETARTLTHKGQSLQVWCGCMVQLPHGYLLMWYNIMLSNAAYCRTHAVNTSVP